MKRFQLTLTVVRWVIRMGSCVLICFLTGLAVIGFGQLVDPEYRISGAAEASPQPSPLDSSPFSSDFVEGFWTFAGWDWEMSPPRILGSNLTEDEPPMFEHAFAHETSDQDSRLIESLVALKAKCVRFGAKSRYSLVQSDFQLFVDTSVQGGRTGIRAAHFRYRDPSDATWREVAIRRKNPAKTLNREISLPLPDSAVAACSRISCDGQVSAILMTSLFINGSLLEIWRDSGYTVVEHPNGLICSRNDGIFVVWSPPNLRAHEICLIQVMGEGNALRK